MKRYLAALSAAMLLAAVMAPAAMATQNKVAICHYDDSTGTWELLMVSDNSKAIDRLLAKGDVLPNSPVPNPPTQTLFAVAFTDMNANHTYDAPQLVFDSTCNEVESGGDVMIGEIVDSNGSGTLNAGDTVVPGQYPLNYAASAFGTFTSGPHTITDVYAASGVVSVSDGAGNAYAFDAADSCGCDAYAEGNGVAGAGFAQALFLDFYNNDGDRIKVDDGSPSLPDTPDVQTYQYNSTNDAFVDVQIFPGGQSF